MKKILSGRKELANHEIVTLAVYLLGGDLYAGLVKDARKASEWKKLRVTPHTHNPVDDARGNAEALKRFRELGLKL